MKSALILLLAVAVRAGEPSPPPPAISPPISEPAGWQFSLGIYAPLMGLEGDIGIAGLSAAVDIPFEDILENLDAGASLAFEGRYGKWSLTGDFIWLKLSDSFHPAFNSRLNFRQEQIAASLVLGYALFDNGCTTLDLLAGGALTHINADLELLTPGLPVTVRRASGSRTWIDPFIGLRLRHQISDRWTLWFRGEYGGFGVSSDEYWQAIAGISYRIGEHTSLALAYRIIAVDYDRGNFQYDTEMSGPNLGLVFRF